MIHSQPPTSLFGIGFTFWPWLFPADQRSDSTVPLEVVAVAIDGIPLEANAVSSISPCVETIDHLETKISEDDSPILSSANQNDEQCRASAGFLPSEDFPQGIATPHGLHRGGTSSPGHYEPGGASIETGRGDPRDPAWECLGDETSMNLMESMGVSHGFEKFSDPGIHFLGTTAQTQTKPDVSYYLRDQGKIYQMPWTCWLVISNIKYPPFQGPVLKLKSAQLLCTGAGTNS